MRRTMRYSNVLLSFVYLSLCRRYNKTPLFSRSAKRNEALLFPMKYHIQSLRWKKCLSRCSFWKLYRMRSLRCNSTETSNVLNNWCIHGKKITLCRFKFIDEIIILVRILIEFNILQIYEFINIIVGQTNQNTCG